MGPLPGWAFLPRGLRALLRLLPPWHDAIRARKNLRCRVTPSLIFPASGSTGGSAIADHHGSPRAVSWSIPVSLPFPQAPPQRHPSRSPGPNPH